MKTIPFFFGAPFQAIHGRVAQLPRILLLGLLFSPSQPTLAQTARLGTNAVAHNYRTPIAANRKTLFDQKIIGEISASVGAKGSFTVYSVDANHRISTNVFTGSQPRELADTKNKIHIIPFEPAAAAVSNPASRGRRIVLPMKVGVAVDSGGPTNQPVVRFGEVFLEALETPLRWSAADGCYETTLAVGLDFPGHPEITQLPVPVNFTLITHNAFVKKNTVSVSRPGPPYEQVQLTVSDARAKATVTAHYPLVSDKALPLDCALELDKLVIDVGESEIAAFGLGTTPLTVRRLAKDQSEIADATTLDVVLSVETGKGHLASGTLTIPANASKAETELRSVGLGKTEILASANGVTGKSGIVTYYLPLGLLVATLLGGLLGGIGRYFQQRKSDATNASVGKWILQGVVCGVLIVAAALAGIIVFALPPLVLGTELGVFVTAALAGYAGAPILDRLMSRFGK